MMEQVEQVKVPHHVAMIMDGNGRWAQRQGLSRSEGHRVGSEAVNRVVRLCRSWGVQHLTLYAFSEQNWGRPEDEVDVLMSLLSHYIQEQRQEILENRIRLKAIGDLDRLPHFVRRPLIALIEESTSHQGMTLTLALSYGGRREIVQAMTQIAHKVANGLIQPDGIDEELISAHLYTADVPDPDLLIRTSGEYRLSNFLLWQLAYTELYFMDLSWPEIRAKHLQEAFDHYYHRERRFGLTSAQMIEFNVDSGFKSEIISKK